MALDPMEEKMLYYLLQDTKFCQLPSHDSRIFLFVQVFSRWELSGPLNLKNMWLGKHCNFRLVYNAIERFCYVKNIDF